MRFAQMSYTARGLYSADHRPCLPIVSGFLGDNGRLAIDLGSADEEQPPIGQNDRAVGS